jgi:MFS family permease
MNESPLFAQMKREGKTAKNPFKESFGNKANLKLVLLALFGATAGQGVVWYTGQFYAMNFTKVTLGIDSTQTEYIVGISLLLATPFFIVFGALSDRIGRKPIMLAGCLLAVLSWYPIYGAMMRAVDVTNADRFRFASSNVFNTPAAADGLTIPAASVVPHVNTQVEQTTFADGTVSTVRTTTTFHHQEDHLPVVEVKRSIVLGGLTSPPALTLIFLIWLQVIFVTMVYGPIAAFLVELFPTRIRYTSMSLPYHIGNGVFGGMVPFVGHLLIVNTGNPMAGLWYLMVIASVTVIVGIVLVRERRHVRLADEA